VSQAGRSRPRWLRRTASAAFAGCLAASLALVGCPSSDPPAPEVVVYVALDRVYAQAILDTFTAETGIEVKAKWDTEATKTTGLVELIRSERERPRCDVFWNNEVVQTIALGREGLLEPYDSPAAADLPSSARDPQHLWTGFAARARVLIVNTDLVGPDAGPSSYRDLLDPRWRGRCGVAKPLFGTTATHAAALEAALGPEEAHAWWRGLRENQVVVCAGNADVKDRVAQGELAFGLTDTDDASLALLDGAPVRVVFPDQAPGQLGTLLIPNSVCVIRGAPHPSQAKALVDWLVSGDVEEALARARSVQVPLRDDLARAEWIPTRIRTVDVTWAAVADAFPPSAEFLRADFLRD
jgi:iron(III) transport system substrate-binding protein